MNLKNLSRSNQWVITLAVVSLIESLQLLILAALVFSFIPFTVPPFVQQLFPISLYDVHMERESFFYHIWIGTGLILQAVLVFFNHHRLKTESIEPRWIYYMGFMMILLSLQVFAIFKIFLWNNPWWARDLLYIILGFALMARIFWSEIYLLLIKGQAQLEKIVLPKWGIIAIDMMVVLFLGVLIFMPDIKAVLARMFIYDKFYHLDSFIMAPAWAYHHGLVLNQDITSEYGLTIPLIFDKLTSLMGGLNYRHVSILMIFLCMVYYFLIYGLWRYWLGSVALAFIGVVISIKLQFFHWGVIPLLWIYPSASPLRFLPDIFYLFSILRFTQTLRLRWFFSSAIACGITLAWMMDVGVYVYMSLLAAGIAYVFLIKFNPKEILKVLGLLVLPCLIAGIIIFVFYGTHIFQAHFWQASFEFAGLFMQGWGALPVTEGLKDKQFFAFCIAFIIPVIYTFSLLYAWGMVFLTKNQRYFFIGILSIYGLGLYHYFVHRSGVTSYDAVIIPLIFILLFAFKNFLNLLSTFWQKILKITGCIWAIVALLTGYLFTYYPNILNLSGYDWSAEKNFYTVNFDFSKDAALIRDLTLKDERVALISSFETKILMQANRAPFFYYFPFMESSHMQGDQLRGTYLHTFARLKRTLMQLDNSKPRFIFVQTRLWQGEEAAHYALTHDAFREVMRYIHLHYKQAAQGQYITALKLQ